jgi:sugar/nucleoside kinase (ribokinase family)
MRVLVVGSTVIDLFLKIKDKDKVRFFDNSISFQLGDKIPVSLFGLSLGGNGANVSVGLSRLGIETAFLTNLYNDALGREIREKIALEKVKIIGETKGGNTPLSLVFDFEKERIIFTSHGEEKEILDATACASYDFVYLSSFGWGWEEVYSQILDLVKKNKNFLAFSPGTTQIEKAGDVFWQVVSVSNIIFVNKEEAKSILKKRGIDSSDIKDLLLNLKSLGPSVVSVTCGEEGAYAADDNSFLFFIPPFGKELVEKTGAGDAYSSGFFAAYILGKPVSECMRWGAVDAYYSMQKVGAQDGLLRQDELVERLLANPSFVATSL